MSTTTTDTVKQLTWLSASLKAPRILEAAGRLADQARDAGWSFRTTWPRSWRREVSARNASGADMRIRSAGFGARKTMEDFDFDQQPAVRNQVAALAGGGFLTEARNVVLLGRRHRARPIWRSRSASKPAPSTTCASCSPPPPTGSPGSPTPTAPRKRRRAHPAPPLRAGHRRRGRLPAVRARRREPVLPTRVVPLRARLMILTSNLPFSGWGGVFQETKS